MNTPIRSTEAALVILDISGYTRFIHQRQISLVHAEAIISELMESIIDQAAFPLQVNKLEGDAALLFAETGGEPALALQSVYTQVRQFFPAFQQCVQNIREARRNCGCDACANIASLRLKAIIHVGAIVVKRVRQFEEIAGEPVILLHRLLKNAVPESEYLLLTAAAHQWLGADGADFTALQQPVEGMADCTVHWAAIDRLPPASAPANPQSPAASSPPSHPPQRSRRFRHLPITMLDRLRGWWRRRGVLS